MKIALINVRFSPNLGDGLIAECLEWSLRQDLPDATFSSIDLAGRTGYGRDAGAQRGRLLALLAMLPPPLRRLAMALLLRLMISLRYRKVWKKDIEGCNAAILGGGQLFADADLNFPLKISAVAELCRRIGMTGVVYGVGVSKSWTPRGLRLFRRAMEAFRPIHVAVRDAESAASWSRHFSGVPLPQVQLCRDPGLLCAQVYPQAPRPPRARPLVGLGVLHPNTLNMHSTGRRLQLAEALDCWFGLSKALTEQGFDVALFTNGPSDDEDFLSRIISRAKASGLASIGHLPPPRAPGELVANIARCDAIIAHRLHANIIAYGCGIPHVGLGWDAKLPAFFASVGRARFVAEDFRTQPPEAIAALVREAIRTPVPADAIDRVLTEARSTLRTCANVLVAAPRD